MLISFGLIVHRSILPWWLSCRCKTWICLSRWVGLFWSCPATCLSWSRRDLLLPSCRSRKILSIWSSFLCITSRIPRRFLTNVQGAGVNCTRCRCHGISLLWTPLHILTSCPCSIVFPFRSFCRLSIRRCKSGRRCTDTRPYRDGFVSLCWRCPCWRLSRGNCRCFRGVGWSIWIACLRLSKNLLLWCWVRLNWRGSCISRWGLL